MRLGVDARPLQNPGTKVRGIGKYVQGLLNDLSRLTKDDTVVFYCNQGEEEPEILKQFKNTRVIYLPKKILTKNKYAKIFQSQNTHVNPSTDDIDVFLQTDPDCGIPKKVPTFAVFYDLTPFLFRNNDKLPLYTIRGIKHRVVKHTIFKRYLRTLSTYKNAKKIGAISDSSRNDYLRLIDPTASNKIINIRGAQAINRSKPSDADHNIIKKLGLENSRYLLYIGGIGHSKNVMRLLYDTAELLDRNPDLKLVLVGKEFELHSVLKGLGWDAALRNNTKLKGAIVVPGYLSEGEVSVLLKCASVFPFPSLYEGFGMPPLEAMEAGCPVVCYNNSSLPEVVGDAAIIVENGRPLAPAIQRVLSSRTLQSDLRKRGFVQAAKFTWEPVAKKVYEALSEII